MGFRPVVSNLSIANGSPQKNRIRPAFEAELETFLGGLDAFEVFISTGIKKNS